MKKLKLLQTIQKAVKTKAFIAAVTGVVAIGGVSTYAVIKNQKKAEAANASTYAVLDTNKETDKSKIEDTKVDDTKAAEEAKKKEEDEAKKKAEEEAKVKADNEAKKKAEEEAKQKAEATTTNKSTSNTATAAKPSTSSNTSTAKPSASTNTNTAPAPQPAPALKPTRQSGIDEALTTKINAEHTIPYYTMQKTDPRTDIMIAAARTLAFGGAVPDNIKHEWKPYANRNTIFKYINHSVNVEVTNNTTYYYTRFKDIPGMAAGFNYVIAYYDASINSYKMYYISIMLC